MRYLSWAPEPIGIDTLFGKEKGFKASHRLCLWAVATINIAPIPTQAHRR